MPKNNIRKKAQLGLDIREGGIAIPIAPNMYYMKGRSHDEGGIGIGPNNKNGLEVEGGEVVKVGKNDVKVFSSVPLLRGVSPAQLVMGGANPTKVFDAQEEYKDRNRINDDGTRYEVGGEKIYTPSKFIQQQLQQTGKITIGGSPIIGAPKSIGYLRNMITLKHINNRAGYPFRRLAGYVKGNVNKARDAGEITKEQSKRMKYVYDQVIGENGESLPRTVGLLTEDKKKAGGIHIKPSKRGTFTAAATKHGMSVQGFAGKVLANKEDYSPAMVKKANFARNANRWKKEYGGDMIYTVNGNVKNGLMSTRPKALYGKEEEREKELDLVLSNIHKKKETPKFATTKAYLDNVMKIATTKNKVDKNTNKTNKSEGPWVGQYKTTNVGDWIGLGSNLLGSVASYFMTKNAINKMPDPVKPVMAQAAKLKTRYNIEPQLSEVREAEQTNRAAVRRNTQSSNTSLAREQRLLNEARGARNTLYGQKENIETQLINQDRVNRQSVMKDNVRAYNDYLNRLIGVRQSQNQMRIANINNLISGLTGGVNSILSNIESRRTTNNTLRAIAAANPNVDARLIGGFDYYIDPITKKKYNKYHQYVGTINS